MTALGAPKPAELEKKLGYSFNDPALLDEALRHRSTGSRNNERLEFLGDSVLGLVISRVLFEARPDLPEGDLSRLRSTLVRGDTLAEIGAELDIGPHLELGAGERASGGRRRASILADTLEALLGAVYRDSDFASVEALIKSIWASRLESLPTMESLKDPKTRLQEWLQGRGEERPEYELYRVTGQAHNQTFTIICRAVDQHCTASGGSRRKAEQASAAAMLEQLNSRDSTGPTTHE